MKANFRYLSYVLRHKWYVLLAGLELRVPLWRLLLHDWTKFLPREWAAYRNWFYGDWRQDRHASQSEAPAGFKEAYDYAWCHHVHKNDHHWQFWVMAFDQGGQHILPMSDVARREMLADWKGAGQALGKPDTRAWYLANRENIVLHPETRAWIEQALGVTTTAS